MARLFMQIDLPTGRVSDVLAAIRAVERSDPEHIQMRVAVDAPDMTTAEMQASWTGWDWRTRSSSRSRAQATDDRAC